MPPLADETGKGRGDSEDALRRTQESKLQRRGWRKREQVDLQALDNENKARDMEVIRRKLGIGHDLTEVYSPWRVNDAVRLLDMKPGYALDLTVPGPDGQHWDFSKPADRMKLRRLVKERRPFFIIGSPPCTVYSAMQNYRRSMPGGEERLRKARLLVDRHLEFCCELYAFQIRRGFYFVHGHPHSAGSWSIPCIDRISRTPNVMSSVIDQCAYGLKLDDGGGEAPVKKPTRIMTNSVGGRHGDEEAVPWMCQTCRLELWTGTACCDLSKEVVHGTCKRDQDAVGARRQWVDDGERRG